MYNMKRKIEILATIVQYNRMGTSECYLKYIP